MNDEKKRKAIKYVLIAAIIALMAFAVAISAQNTADTALQPPPVPCTNTTFLQSFSGNTTVCNTVPLSGTLNFFFDNQTSVNTVNASKRMLPLPNTTEFIQTHTNLPDNGSIQNWTTKQGTPNLSFVPAGDFTVHIHASSNHDNMVMIYAKIWEVNNTGVNLNLIGQTEHEMLTTTETQFNMIFVSPNTYFFNTTSSRIMVQIFTHVLSDNPDATLYFGGTADSKLSLPSSTVDASNFVPYTGATRDVNLGDFNITANNINGNISNITTKGWVLLNVSTVTTDTSNYNITNPNPAIRHFKITADINNTDTSFSEYYAIYLNGDMNQANYTSRDVINIGCGFNTLSSMNSAGAVALVQDSTAAPIYSMGEYEIELDLANNGFYLFKSIGVSTGSGLCNVQRTIGGASSRTFDNITQFNIVSSFHNPMTPLTTGIGVNTSFKLFGLVE